MQAVILTGVVSCWDESLVEYLLPVWHIIALNLRLFTINTHIVLPHIFQTTKTTFKVSLPSQKVFIELFGLHRAEYRCTCRV